MLSMLLSDVELTGDSSWLHSTTCLVRAQTQGDKTLCIYRRARLIGHECCNSIDGTKWPSVLLTLLCCLMMRSFAVLLTDSAWWFASWQLYNDTIMCWRIYGTFIEQQHLWTIELKYLDMARVTTPLLSDCVRLIDITGVRTSYLVFDFYCIFTNYNLLLLLLILQVSLRSGR